MSGKPGRLVGLARGAATPISLCRDAKSCVSTELRYIRASCMFNRDTIMCLSETTSPACSRHMVMLIYLKVLIYRYAVGEDEVVGLGDVHLIVGVGGGKAEPFPDLEAQRCGGAQDIVAFVGK